MKFKTSMDYLKKAAVFLLIAAVIISLSAIAVSAGSSEATAGGDAPPAAGTDNAGDANPSDVKQPSAWDGILSFLPMILIFGVLMYFMLYRPQKKQEKAVNDMRSSLKVGDEISTNGGIIGKILQIKEEFLVIETGNDRTKLKIAKWAVRAVEHRAEDDEDEE